MHARKAPTFFLKLDISRAFDAILWPFLFEVLRAKGFGNNFRKWVAILLQSVSTRVIVKGNQGRRFDHARGLRQGDPSSPLLFVMAMDALSALICKAAAAGVLSSFNGMLANQRLSLFADDVALFVHPTEPDLLCIKEVLHVFGHVSGLRVNYRKTSATLIHGQQGDSERVQQFFNYQMGEFPCKYLGLQLSIHKLTKVQWRPMLDQVKHFIPAWQRGLIQRPGRLVLVNSVIAARPIHHLLVMKAPQWVLEEVDKWMRAFLLAGKDVVNGG